MLVGTKPVQYTQHLFPCSKVFERCRKTFFKKFSDKKTYFLHNFPIASLRREMKVSTSGRVFSWEKLILTVESARVGSRPKEERTGLVFSFFDEQAEPAEIQTPFADIWRTRTSLFMPGTWRLTMFGRYSPRG